jgi:hypothetical protein
MNLRNFIRCSLIVLLLLLLAASKGFSQTTAPSRAWNYVLLEGSELTDDCLICGRRRFLCRCAGVSLAVAEVNPFTRYGFEDLRSSPDRREGPNTGDGQRHVSLRWRSGAAAGDGAPGRN